MNPTFARNMTALLTICAGLTLAPILRAAEPPGGDAAKPAAESPEAEVEEESEPFFTCGFDNDLLTAYVWRNCVIVDELVWQPCVWAEFNVFDWFTIGGNVWQNWNLTANESKFGMPRAMNETDFNIHIARSLWSSDDGAYDVSLEVGNDFYTYRQYRDEEGNDSCPNSYEFYLKLTFDNPYVDVYGQYSQAYEPVAAPYFELGLCKETTLAEIFSSESDFLERWTVGAEWFVSFASGKYFTNYLYGQMQGEYVAPEEDGEEGYYEGRDMSDGIGGTTIKGTVAYQVCDHFSLGVVIAYTALLSGEAVDATDFNWDDDGYGSLVWGGLQAKLEF